MGYCKDIRYDDEATIWLACLCRKNGFKRYYGANATSIPELAAYLHKRKGLDPTGKDGTEAKADSFAVG